MGRVTTIGEVLRSRLHGLTVTDAATRLGISRPALSAVLNDRAELSIDLAFRLERASGLDGANLLHVQLDRQIEAVRAAAKRR